MCAKAATINTNRLGDFLVRLVTFQDVSFALNYKKPLH